MRPSTRVLLTVVATAVIGVGLPAGAASAHYEVRTGDTASEIAYRAGVSLHRLIRLNHLSDHGSRIFPGQRLRLHATAAHHRHHVQRHQAGHHQRSRAMRHHWRYNPNRDTVQRLVSDQARHRGVDPHLALAVAWQESGWKQDVRSSSGAIGVMQVLPSTGRWLSTLSNRRLHIRHSHDNVVAGVTYMRFLHRTADRPRYAIAGYYQGLTSVRQHGLFRQTKSYVRSVRALEDRFERGRFPH